MNRGTSGLVSLVVVAALAGAACGRRAPAPATEAPSAGAPSAGTLEVREITLGNAIGADKRVTMPKTAFGPRDTIYAAVATDGAPPTATLAARWTFLGGGQPSILDSTAQTIAPSGPAVTEFHVSRTEAWPAGAYLVEIFAGGRLVGTREFEVR
jgi:hypothetical protein